MEIKYKQVKDLIPYVNNTRTHSDEQVNQIASSIKEFGFTNPVLLDEQDGVIAGHGRIMAAKLLKMEEIPTITLKGLTETQKKAYIIADNKLALNAGWDEELLRIEIEGLKGDGFDIDILGFDMDELGDLGVMEEFDGEVEHNTELEDEIPEVVVAPVIKNGDIIELGKHRLMCGDSTNLNDVQKLLNGDTVQMVFTDPPYNIAVEGKAGTIQNDDMGKEEFYTFLSSVYKNYFEVMEPGAVIYVAHSESERVTFTKAFEEVGFKYAQNLIWNKHSATLSRQDYNWKHEPIIYGWKPGAGHYYCEDFTKTTVIEDKIDYKKMSREELIDTIKGMVQNFKDTVIDYDRPTVSDLHPTMKPVGLVQGFIENSSQVGWIVMDLFGGAGSTMIASENCSRVSRLMELDEKFAQVIVQRYVDYTSDPKIKINGKEVDWYEYKETNAK